ncbi:LicD family protein [Patescibacteria group bacterium]|nr:LicD family protein [Patescibacteria group bacterium]
MTKNIKDLQSKILEIAKYLDKFCKENEITYYLMGGSALGAMRHQGFIPWDDDFDVFMTYKNYKKFIKACKVNLDTKNFHLQEENTEEWPMFFTKIRMNNTTFIEKGVENRKMHKGIYVDIMCLNNVSSNYIYRYLQYLCARILTAQTLAERGYKTNNKKKKIAIHIAKKIIKKPIKKILIKFVRSLNKKKTKYVGHFFGKAEFKHTSFPKNYLGKPKFIKFADTFLPVPNKVKQYLKLRYGNDFMKMPGEKIKKKYPIHAEFIDLEKDYKYYQKNIK